MKRLLKAVAWSGGLLLLALGAVFAINATDEELTELAQRSMAFALPPAPSAANAFADVLALQELVPAGEERSACVLTAGGCLQSVPANPNALAFDQNDFAKLYRAARAKPVFVDAYAMDSPDMLMPSFAVLFRAQERAFLTAASLANAGRLEAALAELEAENAFHRRIAAGSRRPFTKVVAFALLQRDALLASELARIPGRRGDAMLSRLKALVRPLDATEIDVRGVVQAERAQRMTWMQTRRYVRLSDDYYSRTSEDRMTRIARPWWDALAPYLYRPHQSVNLYAAQTEVLLSVASLPSPDFQVGMYQARERALALAPGRVASLFVNPVGRDHPYIGLGDLGDDRDPYTLYIGRGHATQALNSLVALQIELRAAGATREDAVEQALAGAPGAAHPDPFTGEPMRFDRATRTIGFELPPALGPYLARLERSYRRVAVEVSVGD